MTNDFTADEVMQELARRHPLYLAEMVMPNYKDTQFHKTYYRILDKFAHGEIQNLIVQCPPQHGKALADDTLVPTPRGFVRHGDLAVGDVVFGENGQQVKVLKVFTKVNVDCQVWFSDGSHVVCHEKHEWVVYVNGGRKMVAETMEMADVIGRYWFEIDPMQVIRYNPQQTDIDPYSMGARIGSGQSTLQHIPIEYILNSEYVRREFIAGMIDYGGRCSPQSCRVEITNASKEIITDAAFIARTLGEKTEITTFARHEKGEYKICHELAFNPSADYPTRNPKKKIHNIKERKNRSITRIEKVAERQGNCIQVEGGVYLVGRSFIPTHNSQGSSRILPAYMLGLNPNLKIAICSYAATIAKDFNRDVQRIIDSEEYHKVFPDTCLSGSNVVTVSDRYLRNSDVFEIVDHIGSLRVVGRGGSLTSKTVDVMILDDLYKDSQEANSPVVRESAWDWYTKVARTRLHNDSQQLIVFTRWHPEDIIGRIIDSEEVIKAERWADFDNVPHGAWVLVNFEAIKTGEPTELDPRSEGEPLWGERHSLERLRQQQELDPVGFQCLFQGDPGTAEGRLFAPFKTWVQREDYGNYVRSGCYVDVADEGDDYLCAISYDIVRSESQIYNEQTRRFEPLLFALVTDVVYTDEPTDVTVITVSRLINSNNVQKAWIESNNGGSQFAKNVMKRVRAQVVPFYQSDNKEARIVTNAPFINQQVVMPFGWGTRYQKAYDHLTGFLRNFAANKHDDLEDALCGVFLKELSQGNAQPYGAMSRGIKVH